MPSASVQCWANLAKSLFGWDQSGVFNRTIQKWEILMQKSKYLSVVTTLIQYYVTNLTDPQIEHMLNIWNKFMTIVLQK